MSFNIYSISNTATTQPTTLNINIIPMKTVKKSSHERLRHCAFSHEEDANLRENVNAFGEVNWSLIAEHMTRRSAKQCRERWLVLTKRRESMRPWAESEDLLLVQKCVELGPKWNLIENFFVDRNSMSLKNRWQKLTREAEYDSLMMSTSANSNTSPPPPTTAFPTSSLISQSTTSTPSLSSSLSTTTTTTTATNANAACTNGKVNACPKKNDAADEEEDDDNSLNNEFWNFFQFNESTDVADLFPMGNEQCSLASSNDYDIW